MQLIRRKITPAVQYLADKIDQFTLIDVGCSGGIDRAWRDFGDRLCGYGFDPTKAEIERLTAEETNPHFRYVRGYVGPVSGTFLYRSPWRRLSVYQAQQVAKFGKYEIDWTAIVEPEPPGPVPSARPGSVHLPAFFSSEGVNDIDFIKIDVDGADYHILASIEERLRDCRVLGVGLEVNFIGSDAPHHHTFHNTDRFMRARGFDLFGLTTRCYSSAALAWPFLYKSPGMTLGGRAIQGDALYLRDFGWKLPESDPADYSPQKYAKLVALFALFNLPDQAAETVLRFRAVLERMIDVEKTLDLLTLQIKEGAPPFR